jgi:phosphoribosylformylglycinamidine (FGAM) synthase-like amidotransferase family enzyme
MEILSLTEEKPLFEIDEHRFNELMQLSRQFYPNVPEWFVHGICNEQCMIEQGYEPDQALADELYNNAQEELKTTEYYIKVESENKISV